ncbi:MAG TPA: trehalose-phosphatase [Acidimicrobiales bacterium]|nr:trehalose-phosphatase [Acidimicrobiales bacterium]
MADAERLRTEPLLDALRAKFPDVLVALDFDGPIAAIVDRPDDARPVDTAPRALRRLAERGVPVAIITGRDVETLLRLSGLSDLPGLTVLGVHGAQQWRGGELTQVPEPEGLAELRSVLPEVVEAVDPAAWVEDKGLSLVVHVRAARHPEQALVHLRPRLQAIAAQHELEVHDGKMVLEVRVPNFNKGTAMWTLLDRLEPGAALFAGDDVGDLPAFQALDEWSALTGRPSVRVAVGDLQALRSRADIQCADATAVMELLDVIGGTSSAAGSQRPGAEQAGT